MDICTGRMVLHSVAPTGIELATVHVRYPRMVHADLLTHRMFSRNGRSSRAVPVLTLLAEEPYVPHFMKNQPGMQATEEFSPAELAEIQEAWIDHCERTKDFVKWMADMKVHKQWANRPLEWFGYIDVLITATDWQNFYSLRDEDGAQPEIQDIARFIKGLFAASQPTLLQPGEWHLPYVDPVEAHLFMGGKDWGFPVIEGLRRLSAARCARLTIKPFNGDSSTEAELKRYDSLITAKPPHASPTEHQATPDVRQGDGWANPETHRNFRGWTQYRSLIPGEHVPG